MYRPKGGWGLPDGRIVGRAKPVKKCEKCAKPMVAKGLCSRHYQAKRRKLQMRVEKRISTQEHTLWRESVFYVRETRLLGQWINTLKGDCACPQCGGPSAYGVCIVC